MQIKSVGWFEIYVQDMKRAKAFYESAFSIQLEKMDAPDSSFESAAVPKSTTFILKGEVT